MTRNTLGLPLSEDVLRLNPDLAQVRHVAYKAKSDRAQISDGFDSDLERDYFEELKARGYLVMREGVTFHLPGGVDYTPDFITWRPGEPMRAIEVKGSLKQKNARDSRTRFKIAAGLYPCFTWVWVTRDRSGRWIERTLKVNR